MNTFPPLPTGTLHHVQAGRMARHVTNGTQWDTAIYKTTLSGPTPITYEGLVGDEHSGTHTDYDRAVCIHPVGHYRYWTAYYRREFPLGTFGENLTIDGLLDEDLCVGDILRVGSTVLQITQPRTPCYKQALRIGERDFVKLIEQTGRRGFLARVLTPGLVTVGDAFAVTERPCPEATLLYVNRKFFDKRDLEAASWLANLPQLATWWREQFAARLAPPSLLAQV